MTGIYRVGRENLHTSYLTENFEVIWGHNGLKSLNISLFSLKYHIAMVFLTWGRPRAFKPDMLKSMTSRPEDGLKSKIPLQYDISVRIN